MPTCWTPSPPPADFLAADREGLSTVQLWFHVTRALRDVLLVAAAGWGLVWLFHMRDLADTVWPEGQRYRRGWLFWSWLIPIGDLFVPKMILNDLWAATDPRRRRGPVLLRVWWLISLAAFGGTGRAVWRTPHATRVSQAAGQAHTIVNADELVVLSTLLSLAVVWRLSGRLGRAVDSHGSHAHRPWQTAA